MYFLGDNEIRVYENAKIKREECTSYWYNYQDRYEN